MTYRSVFIIVLFSLLAQAHGFGQQRFVDSMLTLVSASTSDSSRIKIYVKLSDWYIDNDISKALSYADTASLLTATSNWKEGKAASLVAYGNIYNATGDYSKAVAYFNSAFNINKEINSTRGMANNLYSLGSAYARLSNYPVATDYYFKSLRIQETLPNNEVAVANCLGGIAVIYFLQHDFAKSKDYSLKVIEKQQAMKNEMGLTNEYINIADTYNKLKDSANASKYNFKALGLSKKLGLALQEGIVYSQLGVLYHNDPFVSIKYLFNAQRLLDGISPNFSSAILNRGEIGKAFLRIYKTKDALSAHPYDSIPKTKDELLQKAEKYLQHAVTESGQTGDKDMEASFSADLAEVQFLKGNFKEAYSNLRVSKTLQDSLFSQENKNRIAAIESQKKVDLKDREIQISKLTISNQQKTQIGLIAGLCLLGVIGVLLFRQSNTRKNNNTILSKLNTELDEANKVKAKFFGILSHDLRSPVANLINFLHLQKTSPDLFNAEQTLANQKKLSHSAESLLETMESMLLWSKEQMQSFKPAIKKIPVADLFDYIQKSFSQYDTVSMRFDAAPGLTIVADENYMQVIMQNLTSNAIRVLDQPDALIVWKAQKAGDSAILSITDNGPGISPEKSKLLLDGNVSFNAKNGFGFHLIKDLAKAIQFDISINAEQGAGSTFILTPKSMSILP